MDRSRRLVEALGADGLRRVVHDAFERTSLVHAANACKVSYPGKRAQSIPSDTLIEDIAKKAMEEAEAAHALVKALDKACGREIREISSVEEADLARMFSAEPLPGTRPGRLLYALAVDGRDAANAAAADLLKRVTAAASAGPSGNPRETESRSREIDDLRERVGRLEERRAVLEAEALDARGEIESAAAELLQARKQVHGLEARLKRLTEENNSLHERSVLLAGRTEELERILKEPEGFARIVPEMRNALRETQKALHDIRDTIGSRAAAGQDSAKPYLEALASTVRSVQGEITELRRERENDRRKEREVISDLAREQHSMRSEMAAVRGPAGPERPARRKGDPDRVGLFVDVQNMYYAARQLNARLDFGALIENVARNRRLIQANAYVVQNRDIDQSGFLAMLQQRNYVVRRKDLKIRGDGSSKGDWDMEIALDMLDLAESLDIVVLASGDGDFVPLVNRIKTRGPRVEIYSFPASTAKELIEACDRHVAIDETLLIRMTPAL